jgi:hypothetical protein
MLYLRGLGTFFRAMTSIPNGTMKHDTSYMGAIPF